MPLPINVESIESVPEAARGFYKEVNGKFTLDVDGYEDPVNLKSALAKEREAAKTASKQASQWQALGKTPEEIQALVEAQAQSERDKLTKNGEWDKLREQMTKQHQVELQKERDEKAAISKSLEKRLIDADAIAALAAADGSPALLLPHVRSATRVIKDGDDYKVQVVDVAGNPRVNGKGEFLTIADLVEEMSQSDVYGLAFKAKRIAGSGAQSSQGVGSGKTIQKAVFDSLKPSERAKRMADGYMVKD